MTEKKMILGLMLANIYGVHPGAWRLPEVDPKAYVNTDLQVKYAQIADRGGLQFAFLPDRVFLRYDLSQESPGFSMDPVLAATAIALGTERLGVVPSVSTSFNEPYNLARQLKALDVMSHGRAGWNAVPSYEPAAFANFAKPLPPREKKYERLHEVMQIVQALWGSWGYEAGEPDQSGVFADSAHVKAVNLQGQHVGSRGPLPIPPSEQGQPVIFQAGGSGYGLQVAGMYADVVVGMPLTIEDSRAQREMTRRAAVEAGRDADDVKFVAFASFSLGESVREALDRRRALDDKVDASERVALLGALLGLDLDPTRSDDPLTSRQLSAARPHPMDPRSSDALDLAKNGWSPRDMIARGLVDPYPGSVGTAADAADLLQEWFEAGAVDGFIVTVDSLHDGLAPFVDDVVPVLRDRGLFPAEARPTMRENLGLPALYGLDSRLARHKG